MNRRSFLGVGAGLLSVGTNNVWAVDYTGKQFDKNDESVIYIFLNGGVTHIETFNPIPEATQEFRGIHGAVDTNAGYQIGGDLTKLATMGDKMTVVRSFHHRDANHASAQGWVNTSKLQIPNQSQNWPSYGSVMSHEYGSNGSDGMPLYVKTRPITGDDASFLGVRYAGYDSDAQGVKNLTPNVSSDQFNRRLSIMRSIDSNSKLGNLGKNWQELKEMATDIVQGSAGKAFDLNQEPEKYRQMYGDTAFAKDLLLARRVIEGGAKFVTVTTGGFDTHSNMDQQLGRLLPQFDHAVATLIQDLEDRGMNTLIVITSEFGRTPKLNANNSRDHWPRNNTLVFAGGGYNHGKVLGKTDKNASVVTELPYQPKDLGRTLLNHMGIDKLTITDNQGRPRHMIEDGAKNILM